MFSSTILPSLVFPNFDPVALSLGPITIRWYGLMYVIGIFGGWKIASRLLTSYPNGLASKIFDDSIIYLVMGIVIGGRLGHVLFYDPEMIWRNPLEIFMTWHGGMSFHGGILGVVFLSLYFARKNQINFFSLTDAYTCVVPFGLIFGRIGNFINGELWGRITDVPWAMVFPHAGPDPRHPSQLYEASLEGILLFAITLFCWTRTDLRLQPGRITGVFAIGYGLARIFCEFYREPDAVVYGPLTIGQLLTIPLVLFGFYLLKRSVPQHESKSPS